MSARQMSGDEFTRPFYYDLGLLYEINGRLDHVETMYKKATAIERKGVFFKAVSAIRLNRKDHRCVFTLAPSAH